MNLNRPGLKNTRLKVALRTLGMLSAGWVMGLHKRVSTGDQHRMSFYHPMTQQRQRGFPYARFEILKKGKYIARGPDEVWRITKSGLRLYQNYLRAAELKAVDVPVVALRQTVVVDGIEIANPKLQLGRPQGHRANFWDRGFIAGMVREAPECPYGTTTAQARGFARVWWDGVQRARSMRLGS